MTSPDQEIFAETVDSPVPRALDTLDMSASPVLREQLERIEAGIAEIRKQELDVDTRLGEVQKEKDELVAARVTLEEAANLLRNRLGAPAASIGVRLPMAQPVRLSEPQPGRVPRRRSVRAG